MTIGTLADQGEAVGHDVGGPSERGPLLAVELSLAALTVAGVLGLGRLFDSSDYLPDVLGMALAGHAAAAWLRRRRVAAGVTFLLGTLGFAVLVCWLLFPSSTTFGLPTSESAEQARQALADAWQVFGTTVAPAPVLPGFVLACAAAAWFTAFASDTAALRAGAAGESVVPATALFIFGAALGAGSWRQLTAGAFMLALLACWASLRWSRTTRNRTWLAEGGHDHGGRAILRTTAGLAVACVLAGVLLGPLLPGAEARAMIAWRKSDRGGPSSRVVVSPLVDIKNRLVEQAAVHVFTVLSSERSYWRLTSLETFDGQVWSSSREYRSADGQLDPGVQSALRTHPSAQEFRIAGLSSLWLPSAFRPTEIRGIGARFDPDSASLLADRDTRTGDTYQVTSLVPELDAGVLAAAPAQAPVGVIDVYTQLPADFSPRVAQEARRIAAGSANQFEMARKLQDHFRGGLFAYDLSAPRGHTVDAIEAFLFQTRAGYCEQFAGTYAAMARTLGIPARVAVGFTPGEPTAEGFLVRGLNGHAWPELYFDGVGWVAFEPTPGRGIPGAEAYTGAEESQASAVDPVTATTIPMTTTPTTAAPDGTTTTTTSLPDEQEAGDPGLSRTATTILAGLAALTGLPLAWVAVLSALRRNHRLRRRSSASTPSERVLVAWEEVAEALTRLGMNRRPAETALEYAQRASRQQPNIDGALLRRLAGTSTAAGYGRGLAEPDAAEASEAADELERAVDARLSRGERLKRLFDPRPILPARAPRVVVLERE